MAYREQVLAPDYRFAAENLKHDFIDAMTAHLDAVLRLPDMAAADVQADGARLRAELVALHDEPAPVQGESVPDLYFALQSRLTERCGAATSLVRVGLSRNDLDMTAYKMHGRRLVLRLSEAVLRLRRQLLEAAQAHLDTVLIAYTHHQPGQPTTVAHYLGAVEDQLARDSQRLRETYARLNTCPLGAAALAGSSHPLDRRYTAAALGFDGPVLNTYDAVASADWEFDIAATSQSVALGLGRFVTDLIAWATRGAFRLGDDLVQGSSIMPQKRNPVSLEHARTRLSRACGSAAMVVYSAHNIPFADLNDFGPDIQGGILAQHKQLMGALDLLSACLAGGSFDTAVLDAEARATDTTATELADVLVRSGGIDFPTAHRVVAALLALLTRDGRLLSDATPADVEAAGGPRLDEGELAAAIDPASFVARRGGLGMPGRSAMAGSLERARDRLTADEADLAGRMGAVQRALEELRRPRAAGAS